MQLMAAAIKQEEGAQADALHRQRAMEKRLHEISKVRALKPVACNVIHPVFPALPALHWPTACTACTVIEFTSEDAGCTHQHTLQGSPMPLRA